jgi:hypothetical protein
VILGRHMLNWGGICVKLGQQFHRVIMKKANSGTRQKKHNNVRIVIIPEGMKIA